MTEPAETDAKPGLLDRLRARWPWFDHVMRAQQRYNDSKGDFYAAGITYFTVFALFPLLMIGFAAGGFLLASRPDLLEQLEATIRQTVSGDLGSQLVELMDSAIASRTSVGVIGLATAAWAGLGWMANLREALSQMWGLYRDESTGFVRTKLSDLAALLSAFLAIVVTVLLSSLGSTSVMREVLSWIGIEDAPVLGPLLGAASILLALLVAWALFTWVIARLPRESASLRSCIRAGLIAAVGFEIFKQVASIYLKSVVTGPAGATFGPVLGLMVFAYITARLVLFATAWAATATDNMSEDLVPAPAPAVIQNRVITRRGLGTEQAALAAAVGAVGAWGLSRLFQRKPNR
ncbi:inner membrane protein YhjD [[Mycobacterium] wendilense]|uniref:Inner membrane protein YhjD n=1 Tax=[Mycobacterium] wendilense TaxID=3064284 RepID=A0ABM9MGY6_9MYCO|nr:inner membrane protein YhjD [Mycolicibacterium sp. MU0050]CAJ1585005.1 inner membrane protein YhjD [Mycolicibacterium sp. MU0050]